MTDKRIVILGGGTVNHVRPHFAVCGPAYGKTAKRLAFLCKERLDKLKVQLILTRMAGGDFLETNQHLEHFVHQLTDKSDVKVIIMSCAVADFVPVTDSLPKGRLDSSVPFDLRLEPAAKILDGIRKKRKDIFLVSFKTTTGKTLDEMFKAGTRLLKRSSSNLVLVNDLETRYNMIVTPEESTYHVSKDRDSVLQGLVEMIYYRTNLTFTRSTVISGEPISWNSDLVPDSLRSVVNYCITNKAYKEYSGATAGHFAVKLSDNEFLSSIRKTDFNNLHNVGLVKVVTDGPDTVLAYGAKPSVGGQSQRIVFRDHPGYDCIVHFHCPMKRNYVDDIPTVSQYEFECGSHECGKNTSSGLKQFGNLKCVYLDSHGPNILFNRNIDPSEVIEFIESNFDLDKKTLGYVVDQDKDEHVWQ